MSHPPTAFSFEVQASQAGTRLDVLIAREIEDCSRSFATLLIRDGRVTVDDRGRKPGYVVKAGETVSGQIPEPVMPDIAAEAIPLNILYEDAELLVVNKDPGIVVHPAPGHGSGTLVNALMNHCPDLSGISGSLRPGIVHRLDKDTSGALVVAKTTKAMAHLTGQFKSRSVGKYYLALVYGSPGEREGSVDLPIGRHPQERKCMSVNTRSPRAALTLWRTVERFDGVSLLGLDIRTGRTHQIRVHCQAIGHPVIGDPVYGNRGAQRQLSRRSPEMFRAAASASRQMLHARRLTIRHPADDRRLIIDAPLPPDMDALINRFRDLTIGM